MSKWNEWDLPSKQQQDQCLEVSKAMTREANLQIREGVDAPVLIAGMGSAVADTIASLIGPHAVAPWFEKQAAMIRELQSGGN